MSSQLITPPSTINSSISSYDAATIERAATALRCAPFTVKLFADMSQRGINLRAIVGHEGLKNQYLTRFCNLLATENNLLWLIQVGVLRREVDGQGITDSFRLTPMGHLLLETVADQTYFPQATPCDRVRNTWQQIQPSRFF